MKKLLCLILSVLTVAAMLTAYHVFAAESQTLTVTDRGAVLAVVEVGEQFIYNVGVNSAGYSVIGGEGELRYDSSLVELVDCRSADASGNLKRERYSFPQRICSTGLVANFDLDNYVYYNFSKYSGIGTFSDVSEPYFKVRFKAIAPGTVEIHHTMQYMGGTLNGNQARLFFLGSPNRELHPEPSALSAVETAYSLIGDTNGDHEVNIMDATLIQYVEAGFPREYNAVNADADGDGDIALRDAVVILRYKAGMAIPCSVDEWRFASEM